MTVQGWLRTVAFGSATACVCRSSHRGQSRSRVELSSGPVALRCRSCFATSGGVLTDLQKFRMGRFTAVVDSGDISSSLSREEFAIQPQ